MVNKNYQILPSIFAAHVGKMESELQKILQANIQMIHYDIMDNHFVPNISFGAGFIKQVMECTPNIKADIHLMIEIARPWDMFLELNPYSLTIHLEAGSEQEVKSALQKIRQHNIKAGLSIKPKTPIESIKPFLGEFDLLLIMSVEPGFSFQEFIPESIQKITKARQLCGEDIIIEADGGISEQNMHLLKDAGLDWFVMGGGFFKSPHPENIFHNLIS